MGIIRKQSVQGSIIAYSGAFLGFINVGLLFPHILNSNQVGLVNILVAISTILAQFSTLGTVNVITRMFSYFRDAKSRHHGFLALVLIISAAGFLLTLLFFQLYRPLFVENNLETAPLLVEHLYKIIPITFFTLLFLIFDNYCKVLYNSVIGILLKEFLFRLVTLLNLILLYFQIYSFDTFLNIYIVALCLPAIVLFFYLLKIGEFSFNIEFDYLNKDLRRQLWMVAFFGILSGIGAIAVSSIDKYMVNSMLTLSKTGVYSISFFFGTLITIPSRPLIKIASALIADAWKNKDLTTIDTIYRKSCLNQYIIGGIVFIGIVINMHNIFAILPEEYKSGEWVIIIVSFANLIEMASGTSGMVIQTSERFKVITYFSFVAMLILVIAGYFFIPLFDITGAAIAILLMRGIFVILKLGYIRFRIKMKGWSIRFLYITLLLLGLYLLNHLLPQFDLVYIDLAYRSFIVAVIYFAVLYFTGASEDLKAIIDKWLIRFGFKSE